MYGRKRRRLSGKRFFKSFRTKRKFLGRSPNAKRRKIMKVRHKRNIRRNQLSVGGVYTPKRFVNLQYVDHISSFSVQHGSTLMVPYNGWTWRATSVYDPRYAAGAGVFDKQAAGSKFWDQIYNHYTVVSAKITIKINQCGPLSAGTTYRDLMFMLRVDDNATFTSDFWPKFMNDRQSVLRRFHPTTDNKGKCVLSKTFSLKKFFDVKDIAAAPTKALSGADPAENAYFCLAVSWADGVDEGSLPSPPLEAHVKISYNVLYSEPKDLLGVASGAMVES